MSQKTIPVDFGGGVKMLSKIEQLRAKEEKYTLSLRLDGELNEIANSLAKRTGAKTVQQAIRESIVLYDLILSESEKGKDVLVKDPKTNEFYSLFTS